VLNAPRILRALTDGRVEFVVVGAMAMVTHGSAHVTYDLDLCYARTPENMARLAEALATLHPSLRSAPPGLPFHFDAATIAAGLNFALCTASGPLDLFAEIAGVGAYDEVLARSGVHEIYGLPTRVLSLDGLIAAKQALSTPKDRIHLLELLELKKILDAPQP
jgi:hypothetical protein